MGKILYPKQRGADASAFANGAAAAAAPGPPPLRTHRPGKRAAAADCSHRALNGSTAARDEESQLPPTTVAAQPSGTQPSGTQPSGTQTNGTQPSGTVFVSTCPVCQQCFRNYVSMSQHCRSAHGLRPSDGVFNKYPGKHDPTSGPPLEADTVAAHVAHNLTNWLHGKKSHLLASGSPFGCAEDADPQPSERDRWTADRPVLSLFEDSYSDEPAAAGAAVAAASVVIAGPPVLVKMHDELPAMAAAGAAACLPLNDTPPVLQKCVEPVKPPTFYDEPGAWKFVCLVCYKTFVDKSALFAHQRSSHPHVACTHIEVEAGCSPDVRAACGGGGRLGSAAAASMAMLRGSRRQANRAEPSFTCVACGRKSRTVHQLHEHILACAAELAPAAAQAAATTTTASARVRKVTEDATAAAAAAAADASMWRYGKSRRYRKHHSSL